MESRIPAMARTGYAAKGLVYAITGGLTFMAAFNMGGQQTGKTGVIEYLQKQAFGNILLLLMALGFFCYVGWRFVQAFKDPENIGSDIKGRLQRMGYVISGLLYLSLAVFTVKKLIDAGSSEEIRTFSFLSGKFGIFVFVVAGLSFLGKSIYQFRKTYLGNFLKKFHYKSITDKRKRKFIKNTAYLGVLSRGVVFGILGFIFLKAAYYSNTNEIKDTYDAFSFLRSSSYGAWLMGIVAAGFVCYGIYMFAVARYRRFNV